MKIGAEVAGGSWPQPRNQADRGRGRCISEPDPVPADAISATSNRLVSSGSTQYGYDAMGNTTTVNATPTYHYDAFNRMDSAGGMAYYVNPEGHRLRKTGTAGTTWFAPDQGGSLLAENSNGAWIDYVWVNGRLIGRMANNQVYAIHDDQVGRPEVMTDASQNVVWRAQNFAFTQNVTTASITLNLGFPGQYYDTETGLWNNGFRDYNPILGRYVESDPMGLGGGANTYAYAENNPMDNVDPLGLCDEKKCTQARKAAAELGDAFENFSSAAGWLAIASGFGDALAGAGEEASLGADTPATVSLASATSFFGSVSFYAGAGGAALHSFANGNLTSLGNFNFSQLYGLAAKATASRVPGVSAFAETIGG